jgi:hypothetical protein
MTYNNSIELIRAEINRLYPITRHLEYNIVELRLGVNRLQIFPKTNKLQTLRYFYMHTVPLLESANLLRENAFVESWYWATLQMCLDFHLRYIDYILDQDEKINIVSTAKISQEFLSHVYTFLWNGCRQWTPKALAIYNQMFSYEEENERGLFHDYSSLWRRVSPLTILGECYLCDEIDDTKYAWTYRNYLSWLLIHYDAYDLLKDLANKVNTPVTFLVRESNLSGQYNVEHLNVCCRILDKIDQAGNLSFKL